jgi:hypothetical protein
MSTWAGITDTTISLCCPACQLLTDIGFKVKPVSERGCMLKIAVYPSGF